MDWRERNYYLVYTNPFAYCMRHEYYRLAAPSLKCRSPFGHFRDYISTYNYDGYHEETVETWGCPQEMISCRIEDSEALEYELRKAVRRRDGIFCKLTKEMCGQ